MKKILILAALAFGMNVSAQTTINQLDSTYNASYGDSVLTTATIQKVETQESAFICYQVNTGGNIYVAPDVNQRGSSNWFRFDTKAVATGKTMSSDSLITVCLALDGTESLATVVGIFKAVYKLQPYIERKEPNLVIELE